MDCSQGASAVEDDVVYGGHCDESLAAGCGDESQEVFVCVVRMVDVDALQFFVVAEVVEVQAVDPLRRPCGKLTSDGCKVLIVRAYSETGCDVGGYVSGGGELRCPGCSE